MATETQKTDQPQDQRGSRRQMIGVVTSDKMTKTRIVMVTHRVKHQAYQKYVTKRVKYKAHDEKNETRSGDKVLMVESRPLSREKRWRIEKLLERPEQA
jgi:small subunit ribosomal protein S17